MFALRVSTLVTNRLGIALSALRGSPQSLLVQKKKKKKIKKMAQRGPSVIKTIFREGSGKLARTAFAFASYFVLIIFILLLLLLFFL